MTFIGRGALLLAALATPALAASSDAPRSDFNHMSTGFPLTGIHATTACETCHVGGVFKGTPKSCDGCHALGKRVVATPKSSRHIFTDAPCESCHFNTVTFLGAKYNHASAIPGQCRNCHNGNQVNGKPSSHNVGKKLTDSCDSCHRTYAWNPASWNHNGMSMTCDTAGCHVAGQNPWYAGVSTPHAASSGRGQQACVRCHNYFAWSPGLFDHVSAIGRCDSCHNGTYANTTPAGHVAIAGADCGECHTNTHSWTPALGGKPANHILYNAGTICTVCHTSVSSVVGGAALHAHVSTSCKTCHDSNVNTNVLGVKGRKRLGGHEGSKTSQDCTSCHALQYNRWNEP